MLALGRVVVGQWIDIVSGIQHQAIAWVIFELASYS